MAASLKDTAVLGVAQIGCMIGSRLSECRRSYACRFKYPPAARPNPEHQVGPKTGRNKIAEDWTDFARIFYRRMLRAASDPLARSLADSNLAPQRIGAQPLDPLYG